MTMPPLTSRFKSVKFARRAFPGLRGGAPNHQYLLMTPSIQGRSSSNVAFVRRRLGGFLPTNRRFRSICSDPLLANSRLEHRGVPAGELNHGAHSHRCHYIHSSHPPTHRRPPPLLT
jgi:hypothetical protein